MIDTPTLIQRLHALFRLDADASRAYQQAIDNTDHLDVKNQLQQFQADHERHLTDLTALLEKFGEPAPERKLGWKGFLLEGFTAIRSQTGTGGALKAMEANEAVVNHRYRAVLDLDLPPDVRAVVDKNFQDEIRHLNWIRDTLRTRSWEHPHAPGP